MAHLNMNSQESGIGLSTNAQQPSTSLEMTVKGSSMRNIGGSAFSHNINNTTHNNFGEASRKCKAMSPQFFQSLLRTPIPSISARVTCSC
ncbi:hypothetical protein PILCRDRAFT_681327 [Piloderma croceum F 1598]|uniref:Uncharacterized protein n=1 Tax=Piloderma croceum (strain F 1598) TaxID=765440 RepID=A0A0C3F609_PILCF|nr:hypothetical protein PILCRDRAFT_681327 [Piloderma croceum F 1598]